MEKKSKPVEIIKGTSRPTQAVSTGSAIISPPKTWPSPSTSISTMYPPTHLGPHLRQLQRRLRAAQPRQDLQVCHRAGETPERATVQDQPDLPLHQHRPREGRQLCLPHLRLHRTTCYTQIIALGYTARQAYEPFKNIYLKPFRDAGYGQCTYKCTVKWDSLSCWTVCGDWSTR